MKMALDSSINMVSIVKAICSSKDTWQAVNTFAQRVIGKKEEDKKLEKQRKRQEERRGRAESPGDSNRGTYYETGSEPESDQETQEVWEQNLGD